MKKFLVLAALALAMVGFAVQTVDAAQVVASAKTKQLQFRTTGLLSGLTDPNAKASSGTIGYVDSMKASGIAKFDTTVAISTEGWAPQSFGSSATDSAVAFKLLIYDAGDLATVSLGKTSATAESIYVKTQVSANGIGWHDCAIIPGQAPVLNAFTVQTTVNAAVLTFTSSTNTGTSDKLWSVNYTTELPAAGLKSGQDIHRAYMFPFIRFIIMGSRSLNHNLAASVRYWSALDTQ